VNGTIKLWCQPHWLQFLQGAKCGTGPQSKIKKKEEEEEGVFA
jgi:hypothetical protein